MIEIEELPSAVNVLLIVLIFSVNVLFFGSWLYYLLKEYKKFFITKFKAKKQKNAALGLSNLKLNDTFSPIGSPNADQSKAIKSGDIELQSFTSEGQSPKKELIKNHKA